MPFDAFASQVALGKLVDEDRRYIDARLLPAALPARSPASADQESAAHANAVALRCPRKAIFFRGDWAAWVFGATAPAATAVAPARNVRRVIIN